MSQKSPARRRGRPAGATSRILTGADTLGVHHFAFLRAWLQGLDLRWAWDRYVAFSETKADLRHITHCRKAWMAQALWLGHQLNLTLPPERQITALLSVLSREPIVTPAAVLPSLDEFVQGQGLDPDLYSEAELIELYESHYQTSATDRSSTHVQALNQLAGLLAIPPSPADPLSRWLDPRLAELLRLQGAGDLARLVDLVNMHGYRWYRRVPGLGETRARRITAWLDSIAESMGRAIRPTSLQSPQRQEVARRMALRDVQDGPVFGIVPLASLLVPSPLSGRDGVFRTHMPNTLGASCDLEAVKAWLHKYQERPHTLRSYQREVERFYLWCLHERKKSLSSIDSNDCQAYRAFLAQTPGRWIQSGRHTLEAEWRPFRRQLSPASQKLALVIVQTLFEGLRNAGYLAANPMSAVMKGFDLPAPCIQTDRSFTEREWAHLMACAAAEAPAEARTRLMLLLELLVALGLRTDELVTARRSALQCVEVDGQPAWLLTVTGKRRKQREVPVPEHVVELIERHHRDVRQRNDQNAAEDLPLVCVLGGQVRRWVAAAESDQPVLATPDLAADPAGGLSHGGVYWALKRFFARAAARVEDPLIDPVRLSKASTHWLRHTCGRQSAADEVPLEVLQQLLGHASLATTTIYLTTERDRMVRELRRRRRQG